MPRDFKTVVANALAGKYRIEDEIGRGGVGIVFRAVDVTAGRVVAVKVLRPEFAATVHADRFLREIETNRGLDHPGIVPTYDSGSADDLLYLVMCLVEGGTLKQQLRRDGAFPVQDALSIAYQLTDTLAYAHDRGVLHGDVKPDNVFLTPSGCQLGDFGLSQAAERASSIRVSTVSGYFIGTPSYMSPEQAGGEATGIDQRTDIYSLGCVVYEMLVGEPPFSGPDARVLLLRHMLERVPDIRIARPNVPRGVQQAVERALAKSPADRFQSAREFGEDLQFHAQRLEEARSAEKDGTSKTVFIGHGRSSAWRELHDFLRDRLGLDCDEFNQESAAGLATPERLEAMLDQAAFAFLVLTAEDSHADGSLHARENVIHEVGLFQGKLGFRRAIVLIEEGCSEFSNIRGLTQIRFPRGALLQTTEELRAVLEREGVLERPQEPRRRRFWRR